MLYTWSWRLSAENRGGVISRRVENRGILSPEAVASGERDISTPGMPAFVDEAHCIEKWRVLYPCTSASTLIFDTSIHLAATDLAYNVQCTLKSPSLEALSTLRKKLGTSSSIHVAG